jgi:hypothetical protein
MTLTDTLNEDAPTFKQWEENQDFDYQRTESKIVDYINSTMHYGKLDDEIEKEASIDGWEAFFERCGIKKESARASVVREHIRAYVDARSS